MTGKRTALDARELLAELDFVRRLARSLVFDADRRDDAVQDAWLAALQNPPRERAATAGWFHRVLANVARRGVRDEARRRRRERQAAAGEALPSAADVLAREQQRREVVEAVLALPEPYRGTVLARYFDDLAPGAIARRRGVPAATVRSQLARGLAMLRQRLDDLHGGDRRRWATALLPLARPLPTAGTGALAALAGGLLMTKLLFAAGALALGLLAYLSLADGGPPLPADRTEAASSGTAPAGAAGGTAPAPGAADAPRTAVAAAPPPEARDQPGLAAGLRGRVLRPDGTPAAGRVVRVIGIDGLSLFDAAPAGAQPTLSIETGSAVTAADGTFTIAGLWPQADYAVHADATGPERTLRMVALTPEPGAVLDLGDVQLLPKGRIEGRAVDADGGPVAGAEVLAVDLPAAVAALLPFDCFDPAHGGILSVPLPEDPQAGDGTGGYGEKLRDYLARELFVRGDLDRDEGLTALVVDRLPWLETLWRELPVARATSGADGRFELIGVEPGGNLVVVRKPGLRSGVLPRVQVQPEQLRDVGEVELGEGEELRGVVRDHEGLSVAAAEVRAAPVGLAGYRGIAFAAAPAHTDAAGRLCVRGLPRGRAMVAVRRSADWPWHVLGPVATDADLEVDLPAPHALRLRIVDPAGDPVADAAVELLTGPPLGELARAGVQPRLPVAGRLQRGEDGELVLRDLPPGCYTVHASAEGLCARTAVAAVPREGALELLLRRAVDVTVRTVDEAGAPVAGAKVYCETGDAPRAVLPSSYGMPRWERPPSFLGTTDAAGELRAAGLPAEDVVLRALHPALAPAEARFAAVPGDEPVQLVFQRSGSLRGRLFDHGVPAAPGRYAVTAEPRGHEGPPARPLRTRVLDGGWFAFEHVRPGAWTVEAERVADRPLSVSAFVEDIAEIVGPSFRFVFGTPEHQVQVPSGGVAMVEFDLDPNQPPPGQLGASLRGRVLVDGRPPAGRAILQRRDEQWQYRDLARIAADGTFAVASVAAGSQRLRLLVGDGGVWEGDVELAAGAERVLDLCWSSAEVRGRVAFAGAPWPLAGYTVEGTVRDGESRHETSTTTDAAGAFTLRGLPPGELELVARGPDGRSEPMRLSLPAAGLHGLTVALREMPVLSGRVELDGRSARGAMVFLSGEDGMAWWGNALGEDGSFRFGNLEEAVYELRVRVGGRQVGLTQSKFDLRNGSQRGIVVGIADRQDGR